MIKKATYSILLLVIFCQVQLASAQEMMHLQSVVKQEYINPAYNSFRDYVSANFVSRLQWVSLPYHPEVYGANVFVPFRVKRLGLNVTMMRENIGLRKITSVDFGLSSSVKVSNEGFLAFGYGVGLKNTSYRTEDIISYDDSYLFENETWTTQNLTAKLGFLYVNPKMFVGVSSNLLVDRDWDDRSVLWASWDFIAGAMLKLNRDFVFRPDLVVKYYRAEYNELSADKSSSSYLSPIYEPGINLLFKEIVWFGTSYRHKMAETFSVTVEATKNLKVGYTYEYGMGEGVNQFSSHGLNISYRFNQKASLYDFQKKLRLRHDMADVINRNYLYR